MGLSESRLHPVARPGIFEAIVSQRLGDRVIQFGRTRFPVAGADVGSGLPELSASGRKPPRLFARWRPVRGRPKPNAEASGRQGHVATLNRRPDGTLIFPSDTARGAKFSLTTGGTARRRGREPRSECQRRLRTRAPTTVLRPIKKMPSAGTRYALVLQIYFRRSSMLFASSTRTLRSSSS
jgi:hypothetical protein